MKKLLFYVIVSLSVVCTLDSCKKEKNPAHLRFAGKSDEGVLLKIREGRVEDHEIRKQIKKFKKSIGGIDVEE